jgi:hypothetical protein
MAQNIDSDLSGCAALPRRFAVLRPDHDDVSNPANPTVILLLSHTYARRVPLRCRFVRNAFQVSTSGTFRKSPASGCIAQRYANRRTSGRQPAAAALVDRGEQRREVIGTRHRDPVGIEGREGDVVADLGVFQPNRQRMHGKTPRTEFWRATTHVA